MVFLRFLKMCFKSLLVCVLLLGNSLNAMSSNEQEACRVLQVIVQETINNFDAKQNPEEQWTYFKQIVNKIDACIKDFGLDPNSPSIPVQQVLFSTVLPPLGQKFVDHFLGLHQRLGKAFFKDPEQAKFSREFGISLILGGHVFEIEAAAKSNNDEALVVAAMRKTALRLVAYAVTCRNLGINVRVLHIASQAFRHLFGGGQDDRVGTANFVALIFASLEQNGLIGNEERDDILYTYAEIDEMIAFASDPNLQPYVDSLTVFRKH